MQQLTMNADVMQMFLEKQLNFVINYELFILYIVLTRIYISKYILYFSNLRYYFM